MYYLFSKLKKIAKSSKKITVWMIVIMLIIPSLIFGDNSGVKSEKMGRPKAAEVKNMTLIIGTHMIALNSLTQELKEIAEASATATNQKKMYYKSELSDSNRDQGDNNGGWYEIQNGKEIKDIYSGSKNKVSNEIIDGLGLKYYTDTYGKTYDLETGNEVDIFSIEDVHNLSTLEELKELNMEYEAKKNSEKDEDKKVVAFINSIFTLDVKNDIADIELQMDALKKYYEYVVGRKGRDEERNKLFEIRGAVNAKRKSIVLDKIAKEIEEKTKDDATLANNYSEYTTKIIESNTKLSVKFSMLQLNDNSDIVQKKKYQLIQNLINNVKENKYSEADEVLVDILALDNIQGLIVTDKTRQKRLVEELENTAKKEYSTLVEQGESKEYKTAKMAKKGAAELDDLREKYRSQLKIKSNVLELITNMKLKLLDTSEEKVKELESIIDDLNKQIGQLNARQSQQNFSDALTSTKDVFLGIALDSLNSRLEKVNGNLEIVNIFLNESSGGSKREKELELLRESYKKS